MEIGPHLKKIRRDKGYTITEVSQRLKHTPSLLSQIENGKVSPSLQSLEDILRFYAVNFSDFFRQVEQKRFIHVRKGESECLINDAQGITITVLASKLQNNALESFIVELRPGAEIEVATLGPEVNGERVVFVMSGGIEAAVDGGETFAMEEGDSINFKAYVSCRIANPHRDASRFIVSGIPPVFL